MALPVRKHPRLKNYDYSQCGCYHITLCTKKRQPILSRILPSCTPAEHAKVQLTHAGSIVAHYIQNIPTAYSSVHVIHQAIMPNHVHLLLFLESQCPVTVCTIVRSLKCMVTKELEQSIWQDSFYDVVIRNDAMFQCEWEYIDNNPDKWLEDDLFVPTAP